MNIEESDLLSPVLDAGDGLGYVHIGESHRGYLGSGRVDLDSSFRARNRIGYDGPITVESFSTAVVDETLGRGLAVWRMRFVETIRRALTDPGHGRTSSQGMEAGDDVCADRARRCARRGLPSGPPPRRG